MKNLNQTATIKPEQMDKLQVFNFNETEVRTIENNGEIWFAGKDVTKILGYQNSSKALADHVDNEDKLNNELLLSLGQRGGWLINESGLYSLVLSSQLPTAKQFKRWVTSTVIPSIRKHGMYAVDDLLNDPDLAIRAFTKLKEERELRKSLELENTMQKQMLGELQPKVDYLNKILQNKSLVTITQIAKDYGMSGKAMNELLHEHKIQYKESDQWLLYAKYHDMGYTHSKTVEITHADGTTDVKMQTKWTQKGRIFLYTFLKSKNILPVIEQ